MVSEKPFKFSASIEDEQAAGNVLRCLRSILPEWFQEDYLVIDCETTGLSPNYDFMTQVGYCLVKKGEILSNQSLLMQLPPGVKVAPRAAEVTGITTEICNTQGFDREKTLSGVFDLIQDCMSANLVLVGHNLISFDLPFFDTEASRHGRTLSCSSYPRVFDTGLTVKAALLGEESDPVTKESWRDFFSRIDKIRARTKWNLGLCRNMFALDKLANFAGQEHDAGFDCLLCHYLIKAFLLRLRGSAS